MSLTQEAVLNALRHVQDPDLKRDLVSLQMIQDIDIDGDTLSFRVVLTTPACPLKEMIRKDCEEAIRTHIGEFVKLSIKMDAQVTTIRNQAPLLPDVRNIVAVASGKGGVGKSTVAANLAVALAESGAKVGLIDADIFGPSVPTMFAAEGAKPGVVQRDGKNYIIPIEQYGVKLLSIGFLSPPDEAVVWRGPMASQALRQFFGDTIWGELDYLLIDLPPGTSDIHLTLVQTVPVTGAIVVTTPQKVALADAQRGVSMFRQKQINVPVLGIVENMAYFTPAELPDNKYYIFGQGGGKVLAERFEVPFLGEIPLVQSIREAGDKGKPAALEGPTKQAFEGLAQQTARQVAIRNADRAATQRVEMNVR